VRLPNEANEPAERAAPIAVNAATLENTDDLVQETQRPAAKKIGFVKIGFAVVLLSALIVAAIFAFQMRERPPLGSLTATSSGSERTQPTNSIAVLPFENLSADSDNAYLAMGIQDEILSNLARISDLKVISRTSANLYKTGSPRNAQEIGQQLGVAHLLEGSVQRLDKRLRVHAQLIDTRTDSHIWAQTYNRELADLFAIQSEIAQAIADQLKVKISEQERASINRPPTSDLIANALYVQALEFESKVPYYEKPS
jgi:TolB-like protein